MVDGTAAVAVTTTANSAMIVVMDDRERKQESGNAPGVARATVMRTRFARNVTWTAVHCKQVREMMSRSNEFCSGVKWRRRAEDEAYPNFSHDRLRRRYLRYVQ